MSANQTTEQVCFPARRHPDCQNIDCGTCLSDHTSLAEYIENQLGDKNDFLGEYRKWLDNNKIPAETNGWASREAWEKNNVDAFIKYWLGET